MSIDETDDFPSDDAGTESVSADDMPRERTLVSARWASALRRLMDERGTTQLELAALADVDKDTVSNIMRGESSSTATMEKLAQALGVDVSELVLTAEQSRILAESRVRGDDLARRISTELSASFASTSALTSAPIVRAADEIGPRAVSYPRDQERRSGRDRRQTSVKRVGRDRRA